MISTIFNPIKKCCLVCLLCLLMCAALWACLPSTGEPQQPVFVTIKVDQEEITVAIQPGQSVQDALNNAGITINPLDRISPSVNAILVENGTIIKITRITEAFEIVQNTIPFEQQLVRNESLPEGETRLIQPGANGLQEITYRYVFEDGIETSKTQMKTVVIQEPIAEITMVGVLEPFTTIDFHSRIVFLSAGNIWLLDGKTSNRIPIISNGEADGHILELSPDGNWLLYSSKPDDSSIGDINTLWIVFLDDPATKINLEVNNVIHFADWLPDETFTVAYSTVEPRATAPGWQANNDLQVVRINRADGTFFKEEIIPINAGGIYGWWGMDFAVSNSGKIAYSRPDEVGLVDFSDKQLLPLFSLTPLETSSDWAWIPPITWSSDNQFLFSVTSESGQTMNESFSISAFDASSADHITLFEKTGMFAYTATSSKADAGSAIAFLQAIFPEKSQTSRYNLVLADQDGSNQTIIFPHEGATGIEPQQIKWLVDPVNNANYIALIYQGNLWMIHLEDLSFTQITGDGLTTKIDCH